MTALRTDVDVTIRRRPEEVWEVVSDYASDHRWRRGIVEMTPDAPGSPRVGTHVREVLRLAGKEYVTESVVTETGPDLRYRFAGTGTSGEVRGGRSVLPAGRETSVFTYDVELEPRDVPRIAQPVLRWWLTRSLRRDLRRLRDLVEAR